jgi:hypothetical protein
MQRERRQVGVDARQDHDHVALDHAADDHAAIGTGPNHSGA